MSMKCWSEGREGGRSRTFIMSSIFFFLFSFSFFVCINLGRRLVDCGVDIATSGAGLLFVDDFFRTLSVELR